MARLKYFSALAVITVLFTNFFPRGAIAQDSAITLYLDQAIAAAVNNNSAVRVAQLDENIAAANYKQTAAIYLPQIGFSYSVMNTNNPLNAFGFELQQKSITQNDFGTSLLNHPAGTPDFTTKLVVQQPLVNIDLLYRRRSAAKQTEIFQYNTQRTKENLLYEVKEAYLQLQLGYEAARVLEEALATADSVYVFTDNRFKQGFLQKSDVLNAEVQVTTFESNLTGAKNNIRNESDYLSLLMGVPAEKIYKTDQNATEEIFDSSSDIADTRSDFLAMQKEIEASDLMITANKMSYLPKLNAFGSYQFNDSRMLGFGASSYLAGVQLSWDIFKGNSTKNVIAAQMLERNKLAEQLTRQKDQSKLELNKARRGLEDAQFDIKQHRLAAVQAAEALMILQNRYRQGLANTTDVLMAATQLSQQKYALAQSVYTFNVTKAYLQFLTASAK